MSNLGKTFKNIRKTKNLTLEEVAGDDFSVSMLSKFENGKTEISAEKLNRALSNMRVSIEEYYYLAKGMENDDFMKIYYKSVKYRYQKNITALKKLYQEELDLGKKNKYGKYHILNSIIVAYSISMIDNTFDIPDEHRKLLHDYLFGIEMWGQYEMILMTSIVSFTNSNIYLNYAREMVKNVDYLKEASTILNAIQIVVLHGLSLCIGENNDFGVTYFYKKAKEYIEGDRDKYMVIIFMFFEGQYYIYKNDIEKGKELMKKCIKIFEAIGDLSSASYYQKYYDEIIEELERQ